MAQKKFTDLTAAVGLNKTDLLAVEQADGTKKATFERLCNDIMTPDVVEHKWQQDAIEKIETYILQASIIQSFPAESFDPENPEDETTKKLKAEVISGLLAYTMNEQILQVVSDHGALAADYEILKREQMASYGYYGAEWNVDDLMTLVKAGKWDKFAIGDYFVETNTAGEKILSCPRATVWKHIINTTQQTRTPEDMRRPSCPRIWKRKRTNSRRSCRAI